MIIKYKMKVQKVMINSFPSEFELKLRRNEGSPITPEHQTPTDKMNKKRLRTHTINARNNDYKH